MATVSIQEAQSSLAELIHKLEPGERLIITENDRPVACLSAARKLGEQPRRAGSLRGTVLHMAADFDAPLDDFKEYME
jgi:antitoxin (DNA-binding transcriptional repressor) of toxin-antitoxin stability system